MRFYWNLPSFHIAY